MYIYTLKGWYEMNRTYELLRQEHRLYLRTLEALACYKQAYQTFERSERITRVMSLWSLTLQERMDMKYFERQYAYMARDEAQRQIDLFRFANDLCIRDILEEIIICEEKNRHPFSGIQYFATRILGQEGKKKESATKV